MNSGNYLIVNPITHLNGQNNRRIHKIEIPINKRFF